MTPPCHNRPAWRETVSVQRGWTDDGRRIMVEVPDHMSQGCNVWAGTGIGPQNERYPVAMGWDCTGCRWWPREHGGTA